MSLESPREIIEEKTFNRWVRITPDPLDLSSLQSFAIHQDAGAISSFFGTTRSNFNGKVVVQLEYEAYSPLALKELQSIVTQLFRKYGSYHDGQQHGLIAIALHHRIGCVPICESSVAVVVSSPHRSESLAACCDGIDLIKSSVPIWKKEWYQDGSSLWKENCENCLPSSSATQPSNIQRLLQQQKLPSESKLSTTVESSKSIDA